MIDPDGETGYQPAMDIHKLTIQYVIDALENNGSDNIPMEQTEALQSLGQALETFRRTVEDSSANRLLKDIGWADPDIILL